MRSLNQTTRTHHATGSSTAAALDHITRHLIHFPEQLELFETA